MTRIPPEIDQLMWTVAEGDSQSARDEFVRRYPIYRDELLRRHATITGLRTGNPTTKIPQKSIPRFTPRELPPPERSPRQIAVVSGLVLAALAVGSYTLTTFLSPPPKAPTLPTRPPEETVAVTQPPVNRAPITPTPPSTHGNGIAPGTAEEPKYVRPTSLAIKSASMQTVLRMLGAQCGLRIIMAPGLPDTTVSVRYENMTPMAILQDMGAQYRFTPFDQGDGSVVIYPVASASGGLPTVDGSIEGRRLGN